jgi:hypothetical protein
VCGQDRSCLRKLVESPEAEPAASADEALRLAAEGIERRTTFVGLQHDDLARLAAAQEVVVARADDYVTAFFDYLAGFEEAAALFSKPAILGEAKRLGGGHPIATVEDGYGKRPLIKGFACR